MNEECLIAVDIRPAGDGPFGNTTNTADAQDGNAFDGTNAVEPQTFFWCRCSLVDAAFAFVTQHYGDVLRRLAGGA